MCDVWFINVFKYICFFMLFYTLNCIWHVAIKISIINYQYPSIIFFYYFGDFIYFFYRLWRNLYKSLAFANLLPDKIFYLKNSYFFISKLISFIILFNILFEPDFIYLFKLFYRKSVKKFISNYNRRKIFNFLKIVYPSYFKWSIFFFLFFY